MNTVYSIVCFLRYFFSILPFYVVISSPYVSRANVILKKEVACGQQRYTIVDNQCRNKYNGFVLSDQGQCVLQFFQTNQSSTCYELIVSLSKEENAYELFLAHFDAEDRDFSMRSLRINFAAPHIEKNAEMFDDFLTTRPWWTVTEEFYQDLRKENGSATGVVSQVHLEKGRADMDDFFRAAVAINFPSPSACDRASMLVGRAGCVNPGWFSAFAVYSMNYESHPYAVKHIFYSDSYGTNAWINSRSGADSSICSHVNKWRCAFLATTNCSEPDRFLSYCSKGKKCNNLVNSILLTNASRAGQVVPSSNIASYGKDPFNNVTWPRRPPIVLAILPYSQQITRHSDSIGSGKGSNSSGNDNSRSGSSIVSHNGNKTLYVRNNNDVNGVSMAVRYSLMLRKSALYRRAVAAEIAAFRQNNRLFFFQGETDSAGPPPPCVTAHIRRGDRAIKEENTNFTDYCYNATHNLLCFGKRCNRDAGCGSKSIPFSAVNLSLVASKVAALMGPAVFNIYIASDDYVWVTEQIEIMKGESPQWNFFIIPPPVIGRVKKTNQSEEEKQQFYHFMRSHGPGVSSGAYLFASLEVARRCDGFIGHMGSGTTVMFYEYMCVQHGSLSPQHKYICPPHYDLRDSRL